METEKKILHLTERLSYIRDIFAGAHEENVMLLESKLADYKQREGDMSPSARKEAIVTLEGLFSFVESNLEAKITPMDKVRIVRHPQRICLRDILENVYDNYTEIGSMDEHSIDPSMVIARAYITRQRGDKTINQPVMVIGQEKGHGEEFRNGGSVKPWGNAKALHYMQVAETENIPIHTFVFTPGSYPIEDTPGAAQQIAANLYAMSSLKVPIVAVFSEGGSGGAEAIGLADKRLMLSHGYYSVISPEGAAAIEGRLKKGERAGSDLVEQCASQMRITAQDNFEMGYIDRVIQEPALGARSHHYDFFRSLRQELISATDEVSLKVRGNRLYRFFALRTRKKRIAAGMDLEKTYMRWYLSPKAQIRLVNKRHKKFRELSKNVLADKDSFFRQLVEAWQHFWAELYSNLQHSLVRRQRQVLGEYVDEIRSEWSMWFERFLYPLQNLACRLSGSKTCRISKSVAKELTELSEWDSSLEQRDGNWSWVSKRSKEDRAISCPNAKTHGCLDLWSPDLFGEFAGVCTHCGHHFPMEYQWYLNNVFDANSIYEFDSDLEAGNPLKIKGFDEKIKEAKEKTGLKSACVTFEARIDNIKLVVAMLVGSFRGGTVGSTEGEKFIRAAERAKRKKYPFLAYVHGTAGIRIQEGTNGVIQMPRCTMAVRRYIDAGGLYLVTYDTNSYAGPVASFLGCSSYQFGIRSANVGFAGPGVIAETTGMEVEPHYHNVYKALERGHIQGIWDRREMRFNLHQALLTMGGRNLYYR